MVCRAEMDSHADTTAAGRACRIVEEHGSVGVTGFKAKDRGTAKIVTAAIAYDCPRLQWTYLLFMHQVLHIQEMDKHLLNPFQLREAGVTVNEVPLQHLSDSERTSTQHSLQFEGTDLHIPLVLKGTMSGFECRKPTLEEVNDENQMTCTHIHLRVPSTWDPHDIKYKDVEDQLRLHFEYDSLPDRDQESRELNPLQVRGQDSGDHSMSDDSSVSSDISSEDMPPMFSRIYKCNDYSSSDDSSVGSMETHNLSPLASIYCKPASGATARFEEQPVSGGLIFKSKFSPSKLLDTSVPYRPIELVSDNISSLDALDVDSFADDLLDDFVQDTRNVSKIRTDRKRKGFVSASKLADNWLIGLKAAKLTVDNTTQRAVRDFSTTTGSRRLKPYANMLRYKRLETEMYTDTLIARCKSLDGNTCAQIYCTPFMFSYVRPMRAKSEAHLSLDDLFRKYGVPHTMIPDNAKELTKAEFKRKCDKAQCWLKPVESYTPNANLAEDCIRELKRLYRYTMTKNNAVEFVWDWCLRWVSGVRSLTASMLRGLDGRSPASVLTGDTVDISHMAEFSFYQWVWYLSPQDTEDTDTMRRKHLGRYLGPSENVGEAMCSAVLTARATIMERTSVIPLSVEEENSEPIKEMKKAWEKLLAVKLKKRMEALDKGVEPQQINEEEDNLLPDLEAEVFEERIEYEPYSLEDLGYKDFMPEEEEPAPPPPIADAEDLDLNSYIAAKVRLPKGGHTFANGKVVGRVRDECGELVGKSNPNPLLDTSEYEVLFNDGSVERYSANIIAENIYSQIDKDGTTVSYLQDIIGHRKDDAAVSKSEGTVKDRHGREHQVKTTKGWWFLIELQNETTEWVKLKDLKESNPVELAQYVKRNGLEDEPAFAWWVPWTLKKTTRILAAMKTRYHRTTSKFGIECPKTVKQALELDKETGTTFWRDAIEKEMKTVMVAFDILDEDSPKPIGRKFIKCHLVFDVKAGTLQRKARFVADGSRTDPPDDCNIYASVVSRESVRLAFLIAGLNGLEVLAADCEGAYLNANTRERLYTKCGPEFGEYEGRYAIIVRALYGSKSAAASWRAAILKVLGDLGYQMCRADNDVWMRPAVKADGTKVWEYVLVYSDDLLAVGINPRVTLEQIDQHYKLKNADISSPERYLGSDIGKYTLKDGTVAWAMSSSTYVDNAVKTVETWLQKRGQALKTKASCVFPSGWKPELDTTDLLTDEDASYYQQQIGVLRWMVELGRIDILTEVSMLAAFSAAPRKGHLAAVLHLYAYLKAHKRSKIVFDFTKVEHDPPPDYDWKDFYDMKEVIPHDLPEPRGNSIQTTCYVDSDHAGDAVSRRSRTGVVIFCNRAPIVFYSKKQGSIETSSFGSEFSAMKTAVELVEGLRYKLRMLGCPLDGPTHMLADNMSVVHNCSNPASTLKKKSNSIAYHYVRERCAAGVCTISYVNTKENLADAFTKSQPGEIRCRLVSNMLY